MERNNLFKNYEKIGKILLYNIVKSFLKYKMINE